MNAIETISEPRASAIQPGGEMSVAQIIAQSEKVKEVQRALMKEGHHYGTIPGTSKPTLYKPGAEKLGFAFRLAPTYSIRQTNLGDSHREYEVVTTIVHIPTGDVLATGVGCCSTMESKYRYRNASDYEVTGDDIPKDYKEKKQEYRKQGFGAKKIGDGDWVWVRYKSSGKVENPDIADVFNTCLKMAKKRSFVDAILTATAASDVFEQDLEDLADAVEAAEAREAAKAPEVKQSRVERVAQNVKNQKKQEAKSSSPDEGRSSVGEQASMGELPPTTLAEDPEERLSLLKDLSNDAVSGDVKRAVEKLGLSGIGRRDMTIQNLRAIADLVWPPQAK